MSNTGRVWLSNDRASQASMMEYAQEYLDHGIKVLKITPSYIIDLENRLTYYFLYIAQLHGYTKCYVMIVPLCTSTSIMYTKYYNYAVVSGTCSAVQYMYEYDDTYVAY